MLELNKMKNKAPKDICLQMREDEKKLASCFTGWIVQICKESNKWGKENLQLVSKAELEIKRKIIPGWSELQNKDEINGFCFFAMVYRFLPSLPGNRGCKRRLEDKQNWNTWFDFASNNQVRCDTNTQMLHPTNESSTGNVTGCVWFNCSCIFLLKWNF